MAHLQLALATSFDIPTPVGSPKILDDRTTWQVEQEPMVNHNSLVVTKPEKYVPQLESLTRFTG